MSHYVLSEWWSPFPFPNFKQLPAVSLLGLKCKDARCTFKLPSCLQITFFRFSVITAKWILWQSPPLSFFFFHFLFICYLFYVFGLVLCSIHRCTENCDVEKTQMLKFQWREVQTKGNKLPLHLKSGPGRDGPSFALYWLAAEHFDIPSPYMKVNGTKGHLYCRNVKLIFCCKTQ